MRKAGSQGKAMCAMLQAGEVFGHARLLPLGRGQMPSRPRHSVSTSPSHCPGSAREPLCWHRTFEGSRPNQREKKGVTNMEAPTAAPSMGLWTHPPGLRRLLAGQGSLPSTPRAQGTTRSPRGEPWYARLVAAGRGLGWECFPVTYLKLLLMNLPDF